MDISATTVLVALLGGAGGAVVATIMEGRFQRVQSFRAWRLAAADDFTTGAHKATMALRDAEKAVLERGIQRPDGHLEIRDEATGEIKPEIKEALAAAHAAVDIVVSPLGRIHLLFGDSSPTGKAAMATLAALRGAVAGLESWPVPDVTDFRAGRNKALESHIEFTPAAGAALEARWLPRRESKDAHGAR